MLVNVLEPCLVRVRVFVGVPVVLVSGVGVLAVVLVLMGMRCVVGVVAHVAPSLVVVVRLPVGFGAGVATQPE